MKDKLLKTEDLMNCIEELCVYSDNETYLMHPERNPEATKLSETISQIYEFVHSNNKNHSCFRVHDNWRREAVKYNKWRLKKR